MMICHYHEVQKSHYQQNGCESGGDDGGSGGDGGGGGGGDKVAATFSAHFPSCFIRNVDE